MTDMPNPESESASSGAYHSIDLTHYASVLRQLVESLAKADPTSSMDNISWVMNCVWQCYREEGRTIDPEYASDVVSGLAWLFFRFVGCLPDAKQLLGEFAEVLLATDIPQLEAEKSMTLPRIDPALIDSLADMDDESLENLRACNGPAEVAEFLQQHQAVAELSRELDQPDFINRLLEGGSSG